MNRKVALLMLCAAMLVTGLAFAKAKENSKPDKDYDFKAVKKIVVGPITSNDVDLGKVDADRKPKIEAILKKSKENLKKNMIEGAKAAKTTIPFADKEAKKEPSTTLILKYNFEQFDNGNFLARAVPFAGKAKVKLHVLMLNGQTKKVVADVTGEGKTQGGAVLGGLDSEVLWTATNMANAEIYKYLEKKTGMEWSFWSGVTKGAKTGVKSTVDVVKEEKGEKDAWKKKKK